MQIKSTIIVLLAALGAVSEAHIARRQNDACASAIDQVADAMDILFDSSKRVEDATLQQSVRGALSNATRAVRAIQQANDRGDEPAPSDFNDLGASVSSIASAIRLGDSEDASVRDLASRLGMYARAVDNVVSTC